jgi:hypothetical protein
MTTAIFTNKQGKLTEHTLVAATELYQLWVDKNGNELRFEVECAEAPKASVFEVGGTYKTRSHGTFKAVKITDKTITFIQDDCHIKLKLLCNKLFQEAYYLSKYQISSACRIA